MRCERSRANGRQLRFSGLSQRFPTDRAELDVMVMYVGDGSALKAIPLDNQIIPAIVAALDDGPPRAWPTAPDWAGAAEEHGNQEGSEAQIADLGDLFEAAYTLLTPAQLTRFYSDPTVQALFEIPEYAAVRGLAEPNGEEDA